ncbi:hypothetical protein D3C75_1262500 [compost metagenome]
MAFGAQRAILFESLGGEIQFTAAQHLAAVGQGIRAYRHVFLALHRAGVIQRAGV